MKVRGFTSAELILCLICWMAWLPLVYLSLQQIQRWNVDQQRILEQQIAIGQLRMALAYFDVTAVTSENLTLAKGNEEAYVSVINEKLMIRPGTWIVLGDIAQVMFYTEGNEVYAVVEQQHQTYEYWIASLPGLY